MPKTMTQRALAANRANAKKSTGPRTPEGKAIVSRNALRSTGPRTPEGIARSSQNAVKHGLRSHSLIPPVLERYESREEYEAMLATLIEELAPANLHEYMLVETAAAAYWRLQRLQRVEAAMITRRQDAVRKPDAFGMPAPHPGIAPLTAALAADPIDLAALREMFTFQGSGRESYTDTAIVELGHGVLANLQQRHEEAVAYWRQLAGLESSLPTTENARYLGRYGAELHRQIVHSLRELRETQATRRYLAEKPARKSRKQTGGAQTKQSHIPNEGAAQ